MKKSPSSQTLNSKLNTFKSRNWKMKTALKLLMLFFVLLSFENSIAQGINTNNDTQEVNTFLSKLKSTSVAEYEKLDGLLHNLNPAIYTYDNTLKTYGENYTILFTDVPSINYIKNNPIPSNKVELVKVSIKKATDINAKIDLSIFSSFSNLKYIYIVSEINTSKQSIANMIINDDNDYTILYKIDPAE